MEPQARSGTEFFYARTFAIVALLALGALAYQVLAPLFGALAWAVLLGALIHPLHVRLTRLLRGRYNLSAGLLTTASVFVVLGPLTALIAAFAAQLDQFLLVLEDVAQRGADEAESGRLSALLNRLQIRFGVTSQQLEEWLGEGANAGLKALAEIGGRAFVGALGTMIGFTVTMFVLFFLLRDGAAMLRTVRALIPLPERDKARLNEHLEHVIQALIYGVGLTAVIQGAMLGVGFAVLGLPAPVVFGVIGAIVALLPLVGTPLVWGPAVIALVLEQRWGAAGVLTAWGVLVSTIDNVLRPILVSGRARIGTLTVFVGIIGGVTAFGTVGLFLGPLVLSVCLALARFSIELRQRSEAG